MSGRRRGATVTIMTKHRLGWPDLLLLLAWPPMLTGHFYLGMALLAVYAGLYRRAARRPAQK